MTNMAIPDNLLERCEDIIKSKNDDRFYRGLVLNNKMKMLLISDPLTKKSAVALNVKIGYMCDPDDLPGLAHLCEHMLFTGTEKHPERNDYNKYLSENGGVSDAKTDFDYTTYCFNVNASKLWGAMDRFAQSFLTPLFTESFIKLELYAIHSEHVINMASDNYRLEHLQKSANPRHPYSKFGAGNKETLDVLPKQMGINVRQRLIEFYEKYYSANIMSLCVLGVETLDELEEMVVSLFGQVQNKEIDIPTCSESPFDDEHFRMKWYMVPIKDTKNLCVEFPIPDLQERYQSKSTYYVSHFLNNRGRGSLLSALKRRGWCSSILCEKRTQFRGFCCLFFEVDLTEKGFNHVDEIITLMFQYIHMLKEQGPIEWIYNEYRDLAKINFRFIKNEMSHSYVFSLATNLRDYPMKEILCQDILFPQWKPELIDSINAIIRCLTSQNIRVYVIAKECENVANETELWYGINYKKEKIKPEIIDMWKNAGHNSEFNLPHINVFIPRKLKMKPYNNNNVNKFPAIILDTMFIRLWFKQDDEYLVPKAKMFFLFASPCITMDPVSFNLAHIYVKLLQDSFSKYVYRAELAGLHWLFECTVEGIILSIYGYDDKQYMLLNQIVKRMLNLEIDPKRFEIVKENYIRYCKCFVAKDLCEQVYDYLDQLFYESVFTGSEILHATEYLTVDRLQAFIPQLFSKVHVECLIHGNMIKKEALDIAKMVESKLKRAMPHITPLWQHQLVLRREVKLDIGCHYLLRTKHEFHKSSCTAVYYYLGKQSIESSLLLQLLAQIIEGPCVDTLRNQEQLGYTVFSCMHKLNVVQGLLIVVQGDKQPCNVEERIDLFIDYMLEYISTMSKDKFSQHMHTLLNSRLIDGEKLFNKTDMLWEQITKQVYNFYQGHIDLVYLKTVTQAKLIKFFKKNIYGPARRKLSLHITPTIRDNNESEKKKDVFDYMLFTGQIYEINDIFSFKRNRSLYPALKPRIKPFSKKGLRSSKS